MALSESLEQSLFAQARRDFLPLGTMEPDEISRWRLRGTEFEWEGRITSGPTFDPERLGKRIQQCRDGGVLEEGDIVDLFRMHAFELASQVHVRELVPLVCDCVDSPAERASLFNELADMRELLKQSRVGPLDPKRAIKKAADLRAEGQYWELKAAN